MYSGELALFSTASMNNTKINELTQKVQAGIDIAHQWTEPNGYDMEVQQSIYAAFRALLSRFNGFHLELGTLNLAREREPKYIGLILSATMNLTRRAEEIIAKVKKRTVAIYLLKGKKWGVGAKSWLQLPQGFVWPLAQYALPIYAPRVNNKTMPKLQRALNIGMGVIAFPPVNARLDVVWKEVNMLSLIEMVDLRRIRLLFRAK